MAGAMAATVLGLCIALAQGGPPLARLPVTTFTLSWTHSVERVRWQEAWSIGNDHLLHAGLARISGSGAGMEPPDDARLIDGHWVYTPAIGPLDALTLANSTNTPPHRICVAGGVCDSLDALAPAARDQPVRLYPCDIAALPDHDGQPVATAGEPVG